MYNIDKEYISKEVGKDIGFFTGFQIDDCLKILEHIEGDKDNHDINIKYILDDIQEKEDFYLEYNSDGHQYRYRIIDESYIDEILEEKILDEFDEKDWGDMQFYKTYFLNLFELEDFCRIFYGGMSEAYERYFSNTNEACGIAGNFYIFRLD